MYDINKNTCLSLVNKNKIYIFVKFRKLIWVEYNFTTLTQKLILTNLDLFQMKIHNGRSKHFFWQ